MDASKISFKTVLVDWGGRSLYYRISPRAVVRVYFPKSARGTDCFKYVSSIAIAQDARAHKGQPTSWMGADRNFLDRVVQVFNWTLSPRSRDTYWSNFARGTTGNRTLTRITVVGEADADETAEDLFSSFEGSGYVLGIPEPVGGGKHVLWAIEFHTEPENEAKFAEFRKAVLDALAAPTDAVQSETNRVSAPRDAMKGMQRSRRDFLDLIQAKTKDFVGRDFVFAEIRKMINNPAIASGYFLLQGDPGIGKTACLAELIQRPTERLAPSGELHILYHFNSIPRGIDSPCKFLESICDQLITDFHLPYGEFPDGFETDGRFLSRLLSEAAERLQHREQLLVVVDALDEVITDRAPGSASLFLPDALPDNVYFVLSSRHLWHLSLEVSYVYPFRLNSTSNENKRDVREYVRPFVSHPGIGKWMNERKLSSSNFVDLVCMKGEWNFMYLHYVLPAIERGEFDEGGIEELPIGLRGYYRQHWETMKRRHPDEFASVCEPIVCVLAAASPVEAEGVARVTQIGLAKVREVLRDWLEFLPSRRSNEGRQQYSVYHTSFREFLEEEIDPGLARYYSMIDEANIREIRRMQLAMDDA